MSDETRKKKREIDDLAQSTPKDSAPADESVTGGADTVRSYVAGNFFLDKPPAQQTPAK